MSKKQINKCPNILVDKNDMFDFMTYSRNQLWSISFNPIHPRTFYRAGENGGIEYITFEKLWEQFEDWN